MNTSFLRLDCIDCVIDNVLLYCGSYFLLLLCSVCRQHGCGGLLISEQVKEHIKGVWERDLAINGSKITCLLNAEE